eukprot:174929-Rhodomonas_salina.1
MESVPRVVASKELPGDRHPSPRLACLRTEVQKHYQLVWRRGQLSDWAKFSLQGQYSSEY